MKTKSFWAFGEQNWKKKYYKQECKHRLKCVILLSKNKTKKVNIVTYQNPFSLYRKQNEERDSIAGPRSKYILTNIATQEIINRSLNNSHPFYDIALFISISIINRISNLRAVVDCVQFYYYSRTRVRTYLHILLRPFLSFLSIVYVLQATLNLKPAK